jgi:hypothetical protein
MLQWQFLMEGAGGGMAGGGLEVRSIRLERYWNTSLHTGLGMLSMKKVRGQGYSVLLIERLK